MLTVFNSKRFLGGDIFVDVLSAKKRKSKKRRSRLDIKTVVPILEKAGLCKFSLKILIFEVPCDFL